jgi:hypothetical protein
MSAMDVVGIELASRGVGTRAPQIQISSYDFPTRNKHIVISLALLKDSVRRGSVMHTALGSS